MPLYSFYERLIRIRNRLFELSDEAYFQGNEDRYDFLDAVFVRVSVKLIDIETRTTD